MFLGWIDLAIGAVLLVSMIVGLWRGLLFEVLSLLGWLVAYFLSQWIAPHVALWVPVGTPGSGLNQVASLVLAFMLVLIVWSLTARLLRALIQASPLSGLDRLMGAGFGLIRGLLITLLAVLLLGMTPVSQSVQWQESELVPWAQVALNGLKPVLPSSIVEYVKL